MLETVKFFCPCSEHVHLAQLHDAGTLKLDTFPTTISNDRTLHKLSSLSFCQNCKALKCRKCIEVEILYKFCPKCMKEMKLDQYYCSKNCFDCPVCGSKVNISLNQEERIYIMNCMSCEWKWNTGVLEKPKALSKVVKSLSNETSDSQLFSELQRSYLQRQKSDINDMELDKDLLIKFEKLKMTHKYKENQISSFLEVLSVKQFDPIDDNIDSYAEMSDNSTLRHYETFNISSNNEKSLFPKSTRLRTKSSKRCKACRSSLMKPDLDAFSTKFYKLSNAIDFLPSIQIAQYPEESRIDSITTGQYLLIMKNPLDIPMNINLSSSIEENFLHRLYLPVSKFKINPKPGNSNKLDIFIKLIPYIELTRNTKLSRVELMNRQQPNFENLEGVLEQNHNYIVLPIKILKHEGNNTSIRTPLFVSVQTDLSNTGFWCVLQFD